MGVEPTFRHLEDDGLKFGRGVGMICKLSLTKSTMKSKRDEYQTKNSCGQLEDESVVRRRQRACE